MEASFPIVNFTHALNVSFDINSAEKIDPILDKHKAAFYKETAILCVPFWEELASEIKFERVVNHMISTGELVVR